jgi:hypothetical protein
MAAPTHDDLLLLVRERLGPWNRYTDSDKERADAILGIITNMVRAYTRGEGFVGGAPNSELSAVVLCAAARLYANTRQTRWAETKGPMSASFMSYFEGWSLSELMTMNRYRVTAQ